MSEPQRPQDITTKLAPEFAAVVPDVYDAQGKRQVGLDADQIPAMFKAGQVGFAPGAQIPVIDPTGRKVSIPSDQFAQALEEGYKYDTPDMQAKRFLFDKYGSGIESAKAGVEAGLRGLTIGLSDPLLASTIGDSDAMRLRQEANPIISTGGEIGGAIAPLILTAGGSAAAQAGGQAVGRAGAMGAARAAAELTPVAMVARAGRATEGILQGVVGSEAKTLAGKMIQKGAPLMAGSALEGALYGGGNAISETALGKADANAEFIMSHVGSGALLGGAVGGAIGVGGVAASELGKSLAKAKEAVAGPSKNIMAKFFGVKPEQLDKYIEMGGREALEDIPDDLSDVIMPLQERMKAVYDDLTAAKITQKEADSALKGFKTEFKRAFQDRFDDAKYAARQADEHFKTYEQQFIGGLESQKQEMAKEIATKVEGLRQYVIDASSASTVGLENGRVARSVIDDAIDEQMKFYKEYGTPADGAISKLQAVKDDLKNIVVDGDSYDALLLKRRIQGLDKITKYDPNAANFDPLVNSALKSARFEMDDALKNTFPAYREDMKIVSEAAQTLKGLKRYGDEQSAMRSLDALGKAERRQLDLAALKKLEDVTGLKITDKVLPYANKRAILESSEAAVDRETKKQMLQKLKDTRFDRLIEDAVAVSPELQQMVKAEEKLRAAYLAKQGIDDIKPNALVGLFEQAMRGGPRGLQALERLQKVDQAMPVLKILEEAGLKVNAKSLDELVQKMSLVRDFSKRNQNGSANINLGAILGSAVGGVGGGPVVGMVTGAIGGFLNDKMGPKIAQFLLDKYATVAAMERMGISVAKEVNSKVGNFLGAKGIATGMKRVGLPAALSQRDEEFSLRSKKKVSKLSANEFKKVSEKVAEFEADPNLFIQNVTDSMKELNKYAPQTTQAIGQKLTNGLAFLSTKVPRDPLSQYKLKRPWRPSDFELAKFSRYYEAFNNPLSVFDDLEKGDVTSEQAETLRAVYPEIYGQVQSQILEDLTDMQEDLPYDKKLSLSVLFDVPLDFSAEPQFILEMQKGLSGEDQQQAAQSPGFKPQALKADSVESRMSGTQKVVNRA